MLSVGGGCEEEECCYCCSHPAKFGRCTIDNNHSVSRHTSIGGHEAFTVFTRKTRTQSDAWGSLSDLTKSCKKERATRRATEEIQEKCGKTEHQEPLGE